jgi:alpha-L-fucosidase
MSPLFALGMLIATTTPAQSPDPYANETVAQRDSRLQWFREARFGMFIHWGVYSVPAGTYDGKQIGGIGEWIMHQGKIPTSRYQAYAKEFNPVHYNADQWVKLAKEAGMKYIVITSKHHHGFAMFNSATSPWNITQATPFKRDPLKELADACEKNGMKLGFYYSQAQDWNHPGGAAAGGHWDKAQDGDMTEYIKNIAVPQVREILTKYGKVACLWWDTPVDMTKERADLLLPLLKLQPGIIYNNRLGGGYRGDTETPEQFIPATGYPGGRDWETCMTMNDTWGYKSYDQNWKSSTTLIQNLIDIASKGGNYLLNVGPTSLGEIPAPSVERLKAVGAWMKQNGKSIYATSPSPFKKLPWGRCTKVLTKDGATLYLHVFDWPKDGILLVPGLKNGALGATLLVGGSKLTTTNTPQGVRISVPKSAPDAISTTIVLRVKGNLQVEVPELSQNADGSMELRPSDALLHGEVQTEGQGDQENIGFWTNPADWLEWQFKAVRPGKYTLSAEVASLGTPSIQFDFLRQTWIQKIPNTGSYSKYEEINLGTVEIATAGLVKFVIKSYSRPWQPLNLRTIKMRPSG